MSVEQHAAGLPAWATETTAEYTLPQRVRDERTAPTFTPREATAWLTRPKNAVVEPTTAS